MAKVQIKSEKVTPFGGIFHVRELFFRYMAPIIDKVLGLRCASYGYQLWVVLCADGFADCRHPCPTRQPALQGKQVQTDSISLRLRDTGTDGSLSGSLWRPQILGTPGKDVFRADRTGRQAILSLPGNRLRRIDTKGSTKAAFQTGCGTALFVPELSTE